MMRVNVFGLGYVGTVSSACLASKGHTVTGIDIDRQKIEMINSGKSPIIEPGLDDLLHAMVAQGNLKATFDKPPPADMSIVCVGTPSKENGSLNYDHVLKVIKQIGSYLKQSTDYHVVNIRSTVLPGTTEETLLPVLEECSSKRRGVYFGVCMNPEFMREGSSIQDFFEPPFTLIGELDTRSGDLVEQVYAGLGRQAIRTKIRVAEMVKYACNAFHAVKVTFANEIGNICKKMNIDSHDVMDILCRDNKLNLSPYYLKPGFAFGGSCLPKDLRAIIYKAKEMDLETPFLKCLLTSNIHQIEIAYDLIRKNGAKRIGVLGLSFKPRTDDLRESPIVELVERLIGKGYEVSIYDKEVSAARIFGSNRKYIESVIPHVSSLLKDSAIDVVHESEVIVVGNVCDEHHEALCSVTDRGKRILDLVRIAKDNREYDCLYEGICW